ncbi:hypothetical protein BBJ28_00022484 [Nothophytophthora sp. Chile5]|nr:hypothetical protein BBJ28_00022484 [Nothophytophthora sp. Chile5]
MLGTPSLVPQRDQQLRRPTDSDPKEATQEPESMAAALLQSYKQWADAMDVTLMDWVDPTLQYRQSPMQEYFLADFGTVFALCVAYLTFVVFGTVRTSHVWLVFLIMKSGMPALKTSPIQFIYNPLQVVLCSYMTVEAIMQAYRNGYSLTPCNAFIPDKPVMGNLMYMFYLSKLLDFFDTFFIVMGKKWKQLSVLHIYWAIFRTTYDGDLYMTIILNGGVHTIMYMYYFVSAHTHEIWWKPYLTSLQMLQFLFMNTQGYLMVSRSCPGTPYKIPIMYLIYVQSLFWLFMNFFIVNYCLKSRKASAAKSAKKQQ